MRDSFSEIKQHAFSFHPAYLLFSFRQVSNNALAFDVVGAPPLHFSSSL
jgi:hypothetical protein